MGFRWGGVILTLVALALVITSLAMGGPGWPTTIALPIIGFNLGAAYVAYTRDRRK